MNNSVEIITIGDEILIGQIVDTNSAWMAMELNKFGFRVDDITTIGDNAVKITKALDVALSRNEIVLITGGLGPTKDDITKKTLADYFDSELVFDNSVYENIENLFRQRPNVLNELTKMQALVPKSCTVIQNRVGTAPIMWMEREGKVVVSMPGVPFEMKQTMTDEIIPRLKSKFQSRAVINKTIQVQGIGESALAIKIRDWENALPKHIKLAYLPNFGIVKLRLSGVANDATLLNEEIDSQFTQLGDFLGNSIFAENDLPLEVNLGNILRDKKMRIAVAESCTGGNIAHKITSVAGSSEYFCGSVTAYQNNLKEQLLKVKRIDLNEYGAVSAQVVEQMAQGVCRLMDADVGIATSGIAGPGGETPEKPVGTVWIAVCRGAEVSSRLFQFGNYSRENVIERATIAAMLMAIESIR